MREAAVFFAEQKVDSDPGFEWYLSVRPVRRSKCRLAITSRWAWKTGGS